jgi:hypothetical protein
MVFHEFVVAASTESEADPVKWIFSTKMAQHKALVLFKLNSHAKMAPDTGSQEDEES